MGVKTANLSGSESDTISMWHHKLSSATVINHLGHNALWLDRRGAECEGCRGGQRTSGQKWPQTNIREEIWRAKRKTATLIAVWKYTRTDEQFVTGWKSKTQRLKGALIIWWIEAKKPERVQNEKSLMNHKFASFAWGLHTRRLLFSQRGISLNAEKLPSDMTWYDSIWQGRMDSDWPPFFLLISSKVLSLQHWSQFYVLPTQKIWTIYRSIVN